MVDSGRVEGAGPQLPGLLARRCGRCQTSNSQQIQGKDAICKQPGAFFIYNISLLSRVPIVILVVISLQRLPSVLELGLGFSVFLRIGELATMSVLMVVDV